MPPKARSKTAVYRPNDSSRTRVAPFFDALASWPKRLLDLAAPDGSTHPWKDQDLTPLKYHWGDKAKGRKEYALKPPVALLSELIHNPRLPEGGMPAASDATVRARQRLLDGDPVARKEALEGLATGRFGGKWFAFEGSSFPDAFIETPDALIVVEGKYTESGATTKTTWMPERLQMLRHLDGAWEIRGGRSVYGIFIVDGDASRDPLAVPEKWRMAFNDSATPGVLKASLPHRKTVNERALIGQCLVGITTWQAIQADFNLSPALLTARA
jgi:hypothetical protein